MKLAVRDIITVTREEGLEPKPDITEATVIAVSKDQEGGTAYFAKEKGGRQFALTLRGSSDSVTLCVYHASPPSVIDPRSGHGFVRVTRKSRKAAPFSPGSFRQIDAHRSNPPDWLAEP